MEFHLVKHRDKFTIIFILTPSIVSEKVEILLGTRKVLHSILAPEIDYPD